ncbi:MAG: ECF-type sigma factor [Acidobacteriota bacterium]
MDHSARARTTEIVAGLGEPRAVAEPLLDQLYPLVYGELRRLAAYYVKAERAGHTLQPTALVHEAYLKLVDRDRVEFRGRTHFFAAGAQAMRRILVDYARRRRRAKRGGDWRPVTLAEPLAASSPAYGPEELLALDQALDKLAGIDARQASMVELRFFGGLKVDEAAVTLGVSKRSAEVYWTHARAWLKRELKASSPP